VECNIVTALEAMSILFVLNTKYGPYLLRQTAGWSFDFMPLAVTFEEGLEIIKNAFASDIVRAIRSDSARGNLD
jgi:hypothetical protein